MRRIWMAIALACTPVLVLAAGNRPYARWLAADIDGDGRLSRAEAARLPRLAASFDAIDRNADGWISDDEVRAWRKANRSRGRPRASGGLGAIFTGADANADGSLDRREANGWPRVARNFDRIDADRDGTISRAELDAWIARRR